jgi:hypothetical protein
MAAELRTKPSPHKAIHPAAGRRFRLTSCRGVRRELAALYADARLGRVPTADASRLANILDVLRRTLEAGELEARLAALEAERAAPAVNINLGGRT